MTRVFVYEYTCAASPASLEAGEAASLCAEGAAMRDAVVNDFQRVAGVDVTTLRCESDKESTFRAAAGAADWSLVIAPEFDDILLTRCRWVLEEGGRLLGPSPDGIELCADKLRLSQWWNQRGVPTPPTVAWDPRLGMQGFRESIVVKPRFGAGGQHTYFLDGAGFAQSYELPSCAMIQQPFMRGQAASVAFLIHGSNRLALRSATQAFAEGMKCHYLGGRIPLPRALESRAQRVAEQAVTDVPGLFGYVGVDVVLGDDGRDWAIEINPRLTTSYVGLRALAETNLAWAMLELAAGRRPDIVWNPGTVEFGVNGKVDREV